MGKVWLTVRHHTGDQVERPRVDRDAQEAPAAPASVP